MSRTMPPSSLSLARRNAGTAPARANTVAAFNVLKAEYAAALPSRFRRTRTNLGGSADAHYALWQHFYTLREYARDWDRNDPLVGQLVDRAVGNILQGGLRLVPQTGDTALDKILKDLWREWSEDSTACDSTGRLAFPEIEALVLRHMILDGDCFALPLDDGTLQMVEGDLVDSMYDLAGKVIHGVELDGRRRPISYWFLKEPIQHRFSHASRYPNLDGIDKRPAFDEDGEPVVLHVFDPKRFSQSRGVTAFHAIADYLGQIEDVNFATLLKQQVAACIALFINRVGDVKLGDRDTETVTSNTETTEAMTPGAVLRGRIGEQITGFSPAIPANEFFQHMTLLLRMVGAQLGLPLELVLLDFSQGNFSSQRMAVEEARKGAERVQESLPRRFHRHVYRWKVREWVATGKINAAQAANPALFAHKWNGRGWAYIDPQKDATADKMRLENMLVSPRDLATERGYDFDEITAETVEDNSKAIGMAQKEAARLSTKDAPISWREVLGRSTPTGMQATAPLPKEDPPKPAPAKATRFIRVEAV